jgi:3-hydroxyacyl-CoA dehydrogenase
MFGRKTGKGFYEYMSRMNVVVIDNEQQHANNIGACMEGSERH